MCGDCGDCQRIAIECYRRRVRVLRGVRERYNLVLTLKIFRPPILPRAYSFSKVPAVPASSTRPVKNKGVPCAGTTIWTYPQPPCAPRNIDATRRNCRSTPRSSARCNCNKCLLAACHPFRVCHCLISGPDGTCSFGGIARHPVQKEGLGHGIRRKDNRLGICRGRPNAQ